MGTGTHELTALVDVGDDAYTASFEDGTSVVVDPRPDVSLTMSQNDGTLSGTVEATDEFGNLDSVQLFVDDERVRDWAPANGTTFETPFSVTLDSDQNSNRVRVVATDDRGQSVADTNRAGEPELVRSGFVNGPVDSYHERIDSDRYTAVHEAVIDLNGVDPGEVSPQLVPSEDYSDLRQLSTNRRYNVDNDQIIISSKWAGQAPKRYKILLINEGNKIGDDTFEVTYSNPEPRIEVIDEGEDSENRGHLLLIDVSNSFDPDGQSLDFQAQDRDRRPDDPNLIGLEFSDTPGLVITDEQQNSVELSSELYDYWSPEFKEIEEVSEGPYEANDTIELQVKTETFHLSDPDYNPTPNLRLSGATGRITEWEQRSHGSSAGHDPNPREVGHPQYVGTVEVDANSYLGLGSPRLGITNVKKTNWRSLPSVSVYEEDKLERTNVDITNIKYTQKETHEKTVSSWRERIRHEARGYHVEDTSKDLEAVTIERRQPTEPAIVDTRTFSSKAERERFVSTHPNWSPGGTRDETKAQEVTKWLTPLDLTALTPVTNGLRGSVRVPALICGVGDVSLLDLQKLKHSTYIDLIRYN